MTTSVLDEVAARAREKRQRSATQFRESLIAGERAVQASRMILHLTQLLQERANNGEDVVEDQRDLKTHEIALLDATEYVDMERIQEIEGLVEHMTLRLDNLYLENEESRRKQRDREMKLKNALSWRTNPSSRFIQLMKGDHEGIEQVTDHERRTCISSCAWALAIVGLIVALAFSTVDFYKARTHPVLRTDFFRRDSLEMPSITMCVTGPNTPLFHQPLNRTTSQYDGPILFGIEAYRNQISGESYGVNEAFDKVGESIVLGPQGCEAQQAQFSRLAMHYPEKPTTPTSNCYSCIRIGTKKPVRFMESTSNRFPAPIQVELAVSAVVPMCFGRKADNAHYQRVVRYEILSKAKILGERGILSTTTSTLEHVIESSYPQRYTSQNEQFSEYAVEFTSFLCNVFLFSGVWYPVSNDIDIKYCYDVGADGQYAWLKCGNGPYHQTKYPGRAFATQEQATINTSLTSNTSTIVLDGYDNEDEDTAQILVFAVDRNEDKLPGRESHIANLNQMAPTNFAFQFQKEGTLQTVKALHHGKNKLLFLGLETFSRYQAAFGVGSFDVEESSRRPSTSLAEYLTDVFEYVGLFTGVCAYSILVAPARMYLRRSRENRSRAQ